MQIGQQPATVSHALTHFWQRERVAVVATLIASARGDFDEAEEALAEAMLRATERWEREGIPERPAAWLLTTARRILIDRARRATVASSTELGDTVARSYDSDDDGVHTGLPDERLALLYTCCHPALAPLAQLTLALKTIGGLSVREIARALLEAESTTAQRLVRTKRKIRDAGIPYRVPQRDELPQRTARVRETLYLLFNEGYGATEGPVFLRVDIAEEAIRLARLLVVMAPADAESLGLLALMVLHHARRDARVDQEGAIVPLEEQDRSRWFRREVQEGEHLLDRAIALRDSGPYQLQAAIAALHCTAATASATDWKQIAILYGALRFAMPTPVVELNAAVALAMVHGPDWGLSQLDALATERGMANYHLLPAARADLLRRAGRYDEARDAYSQAHALAMGGAERRYLLRRVSELPPSSSGSTMAPPASFPRTN